MRQIKVLNGLLWVVNVLLGAGIAVFAFQYLLFPEQVNHLEKVVEDAPGGGARRSSQQPVDYSVLRNLGNPVVPRMAAGAGAGPNELERVAKFLGGYKIENQPASEVAFLLVPSTGLNVNAYRGEPITHRSEPVAELRGWTLVNLTETGAIFTDGSRQVELRRDDRASAALGAGGRAAPGGAATTFDLSQSKSKRTAYNPEGQHESWIIDRAEIDWANANLEQIMADVSLSAYPSGGVKIESAGGLAAQRGFFSGDVVKTVNGMSVKDRADLINMGNNPQLKNAGAIVVVVERAGKPYTLDFRPDFQRMPK